MGLKVRGDGGKGSLGLMRRTEGNPAPPPSSPSPPLGWGERKGLWGGPGGHLTFSDGAIRGRGIVSDKEAGSVPAVATPASRSDWALVFWRHGWLVNGRAVLMGQCSCRRVPIGTGVHCKVRGHRQRTKTEGRR